MDKHGTSERFGMKRRKRVGGKDHFQKDQKDSGPNTLQKGGGIGEIKKSHNVDY